MKHSIRTWLLSALAVSLAVPVLAQSTGADTFKSKCAMCHGADGQASSPMAKSMGVPSVKSDQFKNLTETERIAATENGKGKMPAYKGKLTDAQIKEVITYMQSLEKK